MTTRKIEVFTGNCSLCDDTVKLVKELAGNNCTVEVYNIRKESNRFQQYEIKAVPSIAIDGRVVHTGKPSRTQLEALGLTQHDDNLHKLTYLGMGI
ncbi:thioredoxin family protein (plasmid) [Pseudanabaena biceps]|nr:thioredoxin family protein [Pseudanabaena biceps]